MMPDIATHCSAIRSGLLLIALLFGCWASGEVFANEGAFKNGDVFAAIRNGQISRFSATGQDRRPLRASSGQMAGMCFDIDGNLYATDFESRKMVKYDKQGRVVDRSWGGPFSTHPESCVVDGEGNVYTGEVDGDNRIRKFSADGQLLASYTPKTEGRGVDWIDLAADQCTVFYTSEGNHVMRFDVCRKRQLNDFVRNLEGACFALRVRENGEVMVACRHRVYRLSPTGSKLKDYPIANEAIFAMNLDPDGEHFWTGGIQTGNIYKVHIESGRGTARPVFQAAGVETQSGSAQTLGEFFLGKLKDLLDQGGMGGLAVYGERTAAIAETVRKQEEEKRSAVEERKRREAEEERKRREAERRAEEERKRLAAEEERKRLEAERRAEDERKRLAAEEERKRLEAERRAEDERKRLEEERKRLEAERRAEEERKRLEAERKRREEEERRRRWRVDFPAASDPLNLGALSPEGEARGRLDLSAARVEGEPVARLTTDLNARGVKLEVETAQGWQTLGNQPVEVAFAEGVRHWALRATVGSCTAGVPADAAHHVRMEAPGPDQTTVSHEIPLSLTVEKSPWLVCWWPVVAGTGGLGLLGFLIYGFISPARFSSRVGVVLSPEEDMGEGFFHTIRAQRGSGSGFYRDARIYVGQDFRLSNKALGAAARLRAEGKQVRIQPLTTIERQTADGTWESVPSEESPMRPGVVYRNSMKTFFFELGNR